MATGLWAGVGVQQITPPVGVDLTGYAGRPTGCTGIHDDLYARALVLDNGSERVGLVSLDVLGIEMEHRDQLRERIGQECSIPSERLLLNTSHTHAGPATQRLRGLGEPDPNYIELFLDRTVTAVVEAVEGLTRARLTAGRTPVQVGVNRRQWIAAENRTILGVNPHGRVLPFADILYLETEQGEPLATWFAHACHPTTLGGDNLLVSAEFPGVAVALVEGAQGGRALFAQGCAGDINPRYRGSFRAVERNGRKLGGAVVAAIQDLEPVNGLLTIRAALQEVPLPMQPPPSLEEARARVAEYSELLERAKREGADRGQRWLYQGWLDWALAVQHLAEHPDEAPTHTPFEVQGIVLGEAALVGLPAEVFAEIGAAIDRLSPFPHTVVLGYTNGAHGYLPDSAAYAFGGYEVESAVRYYGTVMFAPESDPTLRSAVKRMLDELAG